MKTNKRAHTIVAVSKLLSGVFSPLLIPTYCMSMAVWLTPMNAAPERVRFLTTLAIFFITAVIPMGLLLGMMRAGRISDFDVSNRKQRTLPTIGLLLCYCLATWYIYYVHAPHWLLMFFVGAVVATIILGLITFKWKISAHGGAIGTMVGLLTYLVMHRLCDIGGWDLVVLTVVILLAGAVGSARIVLQHHTPGQVVAGTVLGAVIVYIFMSL